MAALLEKHKALLSTACPHVHFRMVFMRSKKPICAPPHLSEVSLTLPLKRWPSLVLSRKIVERFLSPRLSPPGGRRCDVLGFVPAGSVSSSSGCFVRQCICSVISLHSFMSRAVHPQEFSKVDVDDHSHIPVCFSRLHIPI